MLGLGTLHATSLAEPAVGDPSPDPIEIEVAGRRPVESSPSSRDPSAASTVIRGRPLQEPGATSADVLERVPGVQVQRTGARSDLATASIRGATPAQTPVYLAGMRLNDDVTGTADLSTVPLWMLDRVEVFRGNAPAHADQLGLGGAVFFEPRLPNQGELNAGATVGSYGYEAWWARAAVGSAQSSALVALRREGAQNDYSFLDDRGTRFDASDDRQATRSNADYTAYDAWAIGRHRLGSDVRVTTLLNAYEREQGVTGLSVIPARHARADVQRMLGGVSAQVPCSAGSDAGAPSCRLELATSVLLANTRLSDPAGELGVIGVGVENQGQRISQRVRASHALSDTLDMTLALQGDSERLSVEQLGSDGGSDASRNSGRAAATASVQATRALELLGLGAVEAHSTRGDLESTSARLVEPSGRAGLRLQASAWLDVLANLGSYVRTPTLGELYGVSPLVRGNTELRPESGYSADLGVRVEAKGTVRAAFESFAFFREANELIGYRRSSFGVIRPYNTSKARVYGIESAGWLELFERVRVSATATALEPLDITPGRRLENRVLPYRSRLVASSRLELHSAPLARRADSGVSVGVELLHRSSRYADPAGLIVIAGHTTLDLDLNVTLLKSRLSLRLACDNVLNARAYDSVGLPLPGRSLYASMELYAY